MDGHSGRMAVEAMNVNTIRDIERAIDALPPEEVEDLYDWLDHRQPPTAVD